jgi:GDP-L-fucose synthase
MYKKVCVTGGTGFLGKRLKIYQPDWVYVSSQDYDLTNPYYVRGMFYDIKPDAVIHLAAKVGGIKDNAEKQEEYFYKNTMINTNVVRCAVESEVPRLLASLSTCAFPDILENYPYTEKDFFNGPPAETNFSYGYSKRMLHVQCIASRKQHGLNYSTFCPSNIYGPGDHFDSSNSHFIAALISKIAKLNPKDQLELWGTGTPLRQQLYVDDLCEIIPLLLVNHNNAVPVIVAPDENLSINDLALTLISQLPKNIEILYNNQMDGQFRKDGSNKKLKEIIGNYNFTKFEDGILKTYKDYEKNLDKCL